MKINPSAWSAPFDRLKVIHAYFMDSLETLCVVESCTGGLLCFWLTSLPGASNYFKGGMVSYQTAMKEKQLGLSIQKIKTQGLVTEDCAASMARSVKLKCSSDWSISTTGVAGPSHGELGENVGKIAFSVCSPHSQKSAVKQFYDMSRQGFQYKASLFALDFLIFEFK